MTTETTTEAPDKQKEATNGLPAGVRPEDTGNPDRTAGAPKAPDDPREKPPVEQTDEEKKAAEEAAAAEAAKKASEEGKADENAKADELDPAPEEYPEYGDPAGDAVVATLKEAGVTPAEAQEWFAKAIESGDMTKIDMNKLVEKLGKDKANLVLAGAQQFYNNALGNVKQIVQDVKAEVGGDENWKKIAVWSQAKRGSDPAFAKQADDLNAMLSLNSTAAKSAAQTLKSLYEADPKNGTLTVTKVAGSTAATTVQADSTPMTQQAYIAAVKAADKSGNQAEVNRLRTERAGQIQRTKPNNFNKSY